MAITQKIENMVDITFPETVEVQIAYQGDRIWIHVDGLTILRICQIGKLIVIDDRKVRK